MEMSGPISYQQHLEGRFHNTLLRQRMATGCLNYRSEREHLRPTHFTTAARPFYTLPMGHNSYHYYQAMHYRWNPGYVSRIRISPYHYYGAGYWHPSWMNYDTSGASRHYSHNSSNRSYPNAGLFHCQICDTHHRSWSHYTRHLSKEHDINEAPERLIEM